MGQDLKAIVKGLAKRNQAKPLELSSPSVPPQTPMAEELAEGLPEPTQYELDLFAGKPMPYALKGQMTRVEPSEVIPVMERVKLNNAMAKAKLGKRLTLAERRLLGKHNLARIMVRLRPRGGDNG